MWASWFHLEVPALNLALRGVVVFIVVLVLLRLSGKRQLGQMGATELVALLLISNAVQNSMNGGDNSLAGGLILAVVLILMSVGFSFLTYRSRFFAVLLEGTPRLVIHDGRTVEKSLRKERMTSVELKALLRKQGIHEFKEVKSGVLESDGTLSVIRYSDLGAGGPSRTSPSA